MLFGIGPDIANVAWSADSPAIVYPIQ